jgi:hypothetical protein
MAPPTTSFNKRAFARGFQATGFARGPKRGFQAIGWQPSAFQGAPVPVTEAHKEAA